MKTIRQLRALVLFAMVILSIPEAFAQWKIGLQGGYVNNTLMASRCYDYDRHYVNEGGFTIGIPVRYEFFEWFALQAELSYISKNYSIKRGDVFTKNRYSYTNSFLEIPIFARFSFGGEKVRGYFLGGGYLGLWLRSNVEGNQSLSFSSDEEDYANLFGAQYFDVKVPFDSRRDNRFEAGVACAVGVEYQLSKRFGVFAEGRYYYSMTDMQKSYMKRQPTKHNSTFAIMVGLTYTINTHDKK